MSSEGEFHTGFDYSLNYRMDGSGCEKVLLVIGFSSCRNYWGPLVDAIHAKYPGRYTTCMYDQRGVGKSTTSLTEKFSSRTIARDIMGLLLHLGWIGKHIPLHIVGWSMGGFGSVEFVNILLSEIGYTLNLASLTLCNTGHKLAFPAARSLIPGFRALGKGILSLIFGISTKWIISDILSVHYSPSFLSNPQTYARLSKEYENRAPFNAPMRVTFFAILQHLYAVLTHYVPKDRLKAIRESGLPIHAVVSSEDVLIHPTASITLARNLKCEFSYLPGGHMSHVEHTDIVLDKLVGIWDMGLSRKFPHFKRAVVSSAIPRNLSMGNPVGSLNGESNMSNNNSGDWPQGDPRKVIETLTTLVAGGIDRWGIRSAVRRLKQPGRLVIGPVLVLPIVLIQLKKIFIDQNLTKKGKVVELTLLVYIFALILIVQEVTREDG
jgi:pimeloyl-ACP methyl ester carboxylesterase